MYDALDEDAPALARTAAAAVEVLNDATAASVGCPGLDDLRDTEAVLVALSALADGLQETTAHLTHYLDRQLAADRLAPAAGSGRSPEATVKTTVDVLDDVRAAAEHLSALLTRAELSMLAMDTRQTS